jgi:WD40 repeat protein
VWNAQTGEEIVTLERHLGFATSVCFSPDGRRLASACVKQYNFHKPDETMKVKPGEVNVWDAQTGKKVLTFKGHTGTHTSVCFSPDGKRLASAGENADKPGEVNVWDVETGGEVFTLTGHKGAATGVCFSPDGKRLATGGMDPKVWHAETGQEILTLEGHTDWVPSVCFSPDGKRLATGSRDGAVKVWDADKGREVLTLKGHTEPVRSVAWSLDGNSILTGSEDGTARLWDALPAAAGQQRQQGHDRAFLERLARPDPAYHRQKADLYEKSGDLFAAAFHLRRLLLAEPKDDAVRKRLAAVQSKARTRAMPEAPPK